jgi:hypothetical protein
MAKHNQQHHYLPICYLKFFTASGMSDGPLTVIDFSRENVFKGSPIKVARQRDYFRVETNDPSIDPDGLEKELSDTEAELERSLTLIENKRALARDALPYALAWSLAKLLVTVPAARSLISSVKGTKLKSTLRQWLKDTTRYEEALQALTASDREGWPSYVEFKRIVDNEAFSVEFSQNNLISEGLRRLGQTLSLLNGLRWTVSATPSGTFLITSDFPFVWIRPEGANKEADAWKTSLLSFPLTKTLLLVGFPPILESRCRGLTTYDVASHNTVRMKMAEHHTFSCSEQIDCVIDSSVVRQAFHPGKVPKEFRESLKRFSMRGFTML